jgi:hypothetical protein
VEQSIGLPRPPIDRHGRANEVVADFCEFDFQVPDQRPVAAGIQFLHRQ